MAFIRRHGKEAIVNIGLEGTPGEAASSTYSFAFLGEGFKPTVDNQVEQIEASTHHPYPTRQIVTARQITAPFTPFIHGGTIKDLILMACPKGDGSRPTFTVECDNMAYDNQKMVGVVPTSLELTFAREAGGGSAMILQGSMQLQAAKLPAGTSVSETSAPAGAEFLANTSGVTVNSVAAEDILAWTWRRTLAWTLGPPDENLDAMYIVPARIVDEFDVRKGLTDGAWFDLAASPAAVDAEFVLATGTANETVTITANKATVQKHTPSGEDEVVETLSLVNEHTGSAEPVSVAFGAAIGASRLGLGS